MDAAIGVPPGPGQISVELSASSLNYHDYMVASGILGVEAGRIPLSDGAGRVAEVGPDVDDFEVGDLVVSTFWPDWLAGKEDAAWFNRLPGDRSDGYARVTATARATDFTKAPKSYTPAQAATLTCAGLTAWRALFVNGSIKPGDVVLTQGSGGVSIFALQMAKAAGATVISTSSSDEKLERLRALGADETINYRTEPEWGAAAMRLTGGRGVDHVVEIAGGSAVNQSIQACRPGGHIALIGVLAGYQGEINTTLLMVKQVRLIGLSVGSREHQLDMVRGLEALGITPVIDSSFPLEGLADAFRHQESGKHFGKIVVEW